MTYRADKSEFHVVTGADFDLVSGRTLAIVGESGSGKSTIARSVMGLVHPPTGNVTGRISYRGQELAGLPRAKARKIYGKSISMIFQEPMRSLNPAYTVGDQIAEVAREHLEMSRKEAWSRAVEVMDQVRIPAASQRARSYPFEFSGGMCQRVMIAMALVCRPDILIADEPTTALDVTVQAQVLDLLKEQQEELGLAMLFITHDLGVVADVADELAVLYAGEVVEGGSVADVYSAPLHPYTEGLLASIPTIDHHAGDLGYIPGRVPAANDWPEGCRFRARCGYAAVACCEKVDLAIVGSRAVRCVRAGELSLNGLDDE